MDLSYTRTALALKCPLKGAQMTRTAEGQVLLLELNSELTELNPPHNEVIFLLGSGQAIWGLATVSGGIAQPHSP